MARLLFFAAAAFFYSCVCVYFRGLVYDCYRSEMECQNERKTERKIFYQFKYRIPFPWILILTPFECLLFLFEFFSTHDFVSQ